MVLDAESSLSPVSLFLDIESYLTTVTVRVLPLDAESYMSTVPVFLNADSHLGVCFYVPRCGASVGFCSCAS